MCVYFVNVFLWNSTEYRDPAPSDVTDPGHDVNDDDYDDDSYAAYESTDCLQLDTSDQLLDTLTEYQQRLEKTNFIDDEVQFNSVQFIVPPASGGILE